MKKTYLFLPLIIVILSIASHFAFFGHPNQTVFDEVHFGKFISGYLNHKYFFDIHPPLGKLAITGMAKITGFKTGFDFKEIGEPYPNNSYLWLRLLPVIAGTLLPLIIYFLARELKFSLLASFSASLLIIFENAILGQSLFILLDSMLLLFGFLGLLLYLISRRRQSLLIFILAVISLSFSLSIKWTGLSFLGLVLIIEVINFIRNVIPAKAGIYNDALDPRFRGDDKNKYEIENNSSHPPMADSNSNYFIRLIILIFLPLIIYFSVFALHFSILNKSGEGDAFMSKNFQKTLTNSNYANDQSVRPANLWEKFAELNIEMFRSNGRINDKHPYASKWYTWPMMARPIYYWNDDSTPSAKIYLFGNPLIFWGSILGLLILIFINLFFRLEMRSKLKTSLIIILGFILNFIPFAFITRPMFLYHYLSALVFAILALCFAVDLIINKKAKIIIFALIVILSLASYLFFAPLTYGLKLSNKALETRLWINNWQ